MLQGNLPRNACETDELARHIGRRSWPVGAERIFLWQTFMSDLFDIERDGTWDKEQWYCTLCIQDLFRSRLVKWWIAERAARKFGCINVNTRGSRGAIS